ncbi:MAG: hypothetical protein O2816_17440 [Planctomycetota bacterium]|nr:hypothetical protein [Planctomycetota bacterium]
MTRGPVTDAIVALLSERGLEHRLVEHEATPTSADSARARGEDLSTGAKALVLKVDERFVNLVLRPTRRLDSPKTRRALGAKKLRFATAEELFELTGLVPGSVPPFGAPILDLPLHVDDSIEAEEKVAFNAGDLRVSVVMGTADYLSLVGRDAVGSYSKE